MFVGEADAVRGETLDRDIIELAGAEDRHFGDGNDLFRHGEFGNAVILRPGEQLRTLRRLSVGDENDLLTLLFVRKDRGGVHVVRPDGGRAVFNDGERDHLAADLGETLHPPTDRHVAAFVEGDDVAGVVPAAFQRLDHARRVRRDVALHDVGALDEKPLAA